MAQSAGERILPISIYANAFLVGGVLMGFEMLGSRYLFPYFGGSIGTWASLISTVLCALAIGYFAGSAIVAHYPTQRTIAVAILIAAAYLACVPATADDVMQRILDNIGDGANATLIASTALLLVPLTLLGTFSPIAVSILTHSAQQAGRVVVGDQRSGLGVVDLQAPSDRLLAVVVALDQPRAVLIADAFVLGRVKLDVIDVSLVLDAYAPSGQPADDLLV